MVGSKTILKKHFIIDYCDQAICVSLETTAAVLAVDLFFVLIKQTNGSFEIVLPTLALKQCSRAFISIDNDGRYVFSLFCFQIKNGVSSISKTFRSRNMFLLHRHLVEHTNLRFSSSIFALQKAEGSAKACFQNLFTFFFNNLKLFVTFLLSRPFLELFLQTESNETGRRDKEV